MQAAATASATAAAAAAVTAGTGRRRGRRRRVWRRRRRLGGGWRRAFGEGGVGDGGCERRRHRPHAGPRRDGRWRQQQHPLAAEQLRRHPPLALCEAPRPHVAERAAAAGAAVARGELEAPSRARLLPGSLQMHQREAPRPRAEDQLPLRREQCLLRARRPSRAIASSGVVARAPGCPPRVRCGATHLDPRAPLRRALGIRFACHDEVLPSCRHDYLLRLLVLVDLQLWTARRGRWRRERISARAPARRPVRLVGPGRAARRRPGLDGVQLQQRLAALDAGCPKVGGRAMRRNRAHRLRNRKKRPR